jgi:hypothetical protein
MDDLPIFTEDIHPLLALIHSPETARGQAAEPVVVTTGGYFVLVIWVNPLRGAFVASRTPFTASLQHLVDLQ